MLFSVGVDMQPPCATRGCSRLLAPEAVQRAGSTDAGGVVRRTNLSS
jgi:hypothetical protein